MTIPIVADRVRETSTTTGTGTLSLLGAAAGFRTFVAGVGNGKTCFYCITEVSGTNWETGLGTVTSGSPDTLARTIVLSSSNSNAAVSFAAGTKNVFQTAPAPIFALLPVTAFGAKGDGSTNDTTAVQAAINAVQTSGGTIYFPEGTYKVSGLTIEGDNVRLLGAGWASKIAMSAATGDTILIGASTSRDGVVIENLNLYPSVTRTSGAEIQATNFTNLRISNLRIQHCNFCINLGKTGGQNVIAFIENIRANDYNRFLYLVRVLDVWISNCSTDANVASATSVIFEGGVESCNMNNCDFVNSASTPTGYVLQMRATDYSTTPPQYNQFSQCYFDSHNTGLLADAGKDNSFVNCWFSARPGPGVKLNNAACENYNFTACRFENCGTHGLFISAGINTSVNGCQAVSNDTTNVGGNGISVASGITGGFMIVGCRCYNRGSFGGVQDTGIFWDTGCDNFVVCNNDTRGNGSNGIINGSGTGATKIVANNLGA